MKIAKQKPDAFRTAVYVTADCYELFYSEPKSLGRINKQGQYWYTADGMRFLNNRDALDYLVRLAQSNVPARAGAAVSVKTLRTNREAKATPILTRPPGKKLVKKAANTEPTLEQIYLLLGKMIKPNDTIKKE